MDIITWCKLTVHDNSWALKIDNFPEFQNVISDNPLPPPPTPTPSPVRKSLCDSTLSNPNVNPKNGVAYKKTCKTFCIFRSKFWLIEG